MGCPPWSCKYVERRRKGETHARARSPRHAGPGRAGPGVAWRGEARRWARAHDMRVNGPPKSGPEPRRPAASFCSLFLLRVQYVFNMETESVTGRPNPTANHISSHEPTNTSRFSPPPLLRRRDFFIPIVDVHLRPGEHGTVVLSDPAPGEGE